MPPSPHMRYSINNQTEKWKVTNDDEPQHGTVTFWNGRSYGFLRPDVLVVIAIMRWSMP
jgi:hypothetical protein